MHFIDDDGINNNCDHGKKSRRKFMHGQMFVLVRIFFQDPVACGDKCELECHPPLSSESSQ
ncbi:hypothetical protein Bca52824_087322 [Brassica carinata]|uniref:Uncharacterized protein n=1 Tax=Brassica carinata TaxID=52824 RepID=A0A8X7TN51_BRACI|nr:hypothetical protein Bca52824_087322 [Brassica carinata]